MHILYKIKNNNEKKKIISEILINIGENENTNNTGAIAEYLFKYLKI